MELAPNSNGPASIDSFGIDLRRLRYFIAVCDHGGISRAASALGMAQPALTRQIQLLEKELGLSLILRSGRGAEPSEPGKFLLFRARENIEALDGLVRDARLMFATSSGQISLGICPTIAPFFLDEAMLFMRANNPNVTLSVIQAYSGDLQNLMDGGRLDMALTYRPSVRTGIDCCELFSERLVLVSGISPNGRQGPVSLAEISRLQLILPSGIHELRRIIERACQLRQVRLVPDLELDSLDAVKSILMKKSSHYFTVLPFHSIKADVDSQHLACRDIDDPEMRRTIAVVTPENPRNPQVLQGLVTHIRAQAAQLKQKLDTLF